jgi:3-methyladenine DNA glycosylase/8-oxoguanine DNA glycosylase
MIPALDLAYVTLVGRLARLGRRATEDEVREFFSPYGEHAGLAGLYALHRRYL